ncbi:MAG: hypothetical protein M5U07_07065 [Xanthobacteraceae bacterium]|nr:hypothetical protein [Xanthobacteraceae bacterium]
MTLAQLQRLIEACGSAPEQWPPGERAAAERLLAASAPARGLLARAREFDRAVREVLQAEPQQAEVDRLLGALARHPLPPQHRGLLARSWPAALARPDFAPAWPRIAALACVGALGIAVGLSNVGARVAYDLAGVAASEEASPFDADAITGLRP